ncbi:heat-inducible transcriptional repressor HrcA [Vagococcus zengguangii]|uniref:Heat-inducible transcription repressor HrcA n=1 Tax=Vagococcus zengguangii TaxID=2571750 RepID=A0A4D7CR07_9ENTE|nr:heat-inducible transcriptional repressor HrcA [Vagococcus zengguangii]QCI86528.1 heat-inducible transcription repressor HrcA [Vagococcus zengguangii]TLG81222.1 heat-inducible transcription repressor HrcA [Vagococcus zengguangii]
MLSQRQLDILRLVIQLNTETGEPIGSKTLMNAGIKASSATIRNDLVVLENQGLIEKPHTSAGRVPSLKGYRFYVDHLLQPSQMKQEDITRIRQSFDQEYTALNDIMAHSADFLSQLTNYTAISLGPEMTSRRLTGFRVIPLNKQQLVAIIITDKGNVESRVFKMPEHLAYSDIETIVSIANEKLVGEQLVTVYNKLRTEIPMILQKYFVTTRGVMDVFDTILASTFKDKVYISGQMNLLDNQMISDVHQIKSFYSLMDNQELLSNMISAPNEGIEFRIGSENDNELLSNMSMITASYEISEYGNGTIAIIGPTNMAYSEIFTLMDTYRKELANYLSDYYRLLDS